MRKIIGALVVLIGIIFPGASQGRADSSTASGVQQPATPQKLEKEVQRDEEQKMLRSRLRGLGYFQ